MAHTVCTICKGWIFGKDCNKCKFLNKAKLECVKGNHQWKVLITMTVCENCHISRELAPELIPSEAELCVGVGIDPYRRYAGDED